jgi:hypothetical protein
MQPLIKKPAVHPQKIVIKHGQLFNLRWPEVKEIFQYILLSVLNFPPQIQHGLPCEISQVSAVRSRLMLVMVLLNEQNIDKYSYF